MDNHRAALWCWQQALDLSSERHNILHIDRHTDALGAHLDVHIQAMPSLHNLAIQDYLHAQVSLFELVPLFRWDNYLSIHIANFQGMLDRPISADHGDGDDPQFNKTWRPKPDKLSENVGYWLSKGDAPWIVNVDLDYFFCSDCECDSEGNEIWIPLFSLDFVECLFRQIRDAIQNGRVRVVTICLTPTNFTPGWEECLKLSRTVFKILDAEHPDI